MSETTTSEKLKVMQAYVEGEAVECRDKGEKVWVELTGQWEPNWNWMDTEYRIKPVPTKLFVNLYWDGIGIEAGPCTYRSKKKALQHACPYKEAAALGVEVTKDGK